MLVEIFYDQKMQDKLFLLETITFLLFTYVYTCIKIGT
jgi:hypothetical protein